MPSLVEHFLLLFENSIMVLILDFGSQYTQLIARRIREMGVYCEVRSCLDSCNVVPEALILSGGPASVLGEDAPPIDPAWLELDVPMLGICYGMQLLAHVHGGSVRKSTRREYGLSALVVQEAEHLFASVPESSEVWMSHGDDVDRIPVGWNILARSHDGVIAAMGHAQAKRYALQFHPEVTHSVYGKQILQNFLFSIAGLSASWSMESFVEKKIQELRAEAPEGNVLCAMSGGVDSAVTATLLHKALGDRLHCIYVDNGLMRKGETEEIQKEFTDLPLTIVDASERFLAVLEGVSDPEVKRKRIGHTFIDVFDDAVKQLETEFGAFVYLAQGTLYPDIIESVSVRGPAATIKSHHNVGGLPEKMKLRLIEPLKELFKDEVRQAGLALGMSQWRIERQPFPGPGMAVRILGVVDAEKVAILQEADAIFDQEIRSAGLYTSLWQSFAVLLPVKSVGVMGDSRSYEWTIVLRAVHSEDGMTARVARLPWEVLERSSTRIINEVQGVNRVAFDISNKPPSTIEWE